ncbi:sigma-70 family RNA polymerase sigma factor [Sphingomonas sp. RB3P16]|uniref:RNA polymerase sigma factor n=1 Tax=Parasphingomonas frigoris TaxID=3096163 RepID=UPI002FC93A8F
MAADDQDMVPDDLVRRWQPALRAFFMRRIRDHADAEDLTQEVLIRLLNQGEARNDSYVFQIAQNLLTDRHRRHIVREQYRSVTAATAARDHDPLNAHEIMSGQQQLALVTAALSALPERTRTIFILYRFEKLSQDEIGNSFGISASAVKQQVAKAMAALAKALRDDR